jgi:hypothetical protein
MADIKITRTGGLHPALHVTIDERKVENVVGARVGFLPASDCIVTIDTDHDGVYNERTYRHIGQVTIEAETAAGDE